MAPAIQRPARLAIISTMRSLIVEPTTEKNSRVR